MNRRQVLCVLGGGAIAAVVPVGGCSSALPPEAIAAWDGPGAEPDVRRWALAHAILAPHSHNLQSWLVDLREPDVITLYVDLTRLLPETDPFSRQMILSQGTFLELLDLAARQRRLRAETTAFPEGAFGPEGLDARPTARVRLVPDPAVSADPLFEQILRRRTNREAYAAQAPEGSALQAIRDSVAGYPVAIGFVGPDEPATLQAHRDIATAAWRVEMTTPRVLLEAYQVLRVGPREIAEHRDGIALNAPLVRLLTALGLFDRTRPSDPDSAAVRRQIDDFNATIAATPAFFWMTTEDNARTTQLFAGRAFVRAQLAATAHGLSVHPLQQALQEYPEQRAQHAGIRDLVGVRAEGQTVQMWARLGYGPPVSPAPRRGVDAHILHADASQEGSS
jgi:hypothetical protein